MHGPNGKPAKWLILWNCFSCNNLANGHIKRTQKCALSAKYIPTNHKPCQIFRCDLRSYVLTGVKQYQQVQDDQHTSFSHKILPAEYLRNIWWSYVSSIFRVCLECFWSMLEGVLACFWSMFGSILHGFILHEVCLGCVVGV